MTSTSAVSYMLSDMPRVSYPGPKFAVEAGTVTIALVPTSTSMLMVTNISNRFSCPGG